jgi:hypothetical protein
MNRRARAKAYNESKLSNSFQVAAKGFTSRSALRRMGLRVSNVWYASMQKKHSQTNKFIASARGAVANVSHDDYFAFVASHLLYDAWVLLEGRAPDGKFGALFRQMTAEVKTNRHGVCAAQWFMNKRHCRAMFSLSHHSQELYAEGRRQSTSLKRKAVLLMNYAGCNDRSLVGAYGEIAASSTLQEMPLRLSDAIRDHMNALAIQYPQRKLLYLGTCPVSRAMKLTNTRAGNARVSSIVRQNRQAEIDRVSLAVGTMIAARRKGCYGVSSLQQQCIKQLMGVSYEPQFTAYSGKYVVAGAQTTPSQLGEKLHAWIGSHRLGADIQEAERRLQQHLRQKFSSPYIEVPHGGTHVQHSGCEYRKFQDCVKAGEPQWKP